MNFEGLWDFGAPAARWLGSFITSLNPGRGHTGMFPGASWSLISFLLSPPGGNNNSLPWWTAALPSIGGVCFFMSLGPAAAAVKSLQLRPTLCNPIDGSPPGSPVPGILQARTLEWIAISFSNAWKWKVKMKSLCRAWLLATPWTAAFQAPPSLGFSRQEHWSGVPLPWVLAGLNSCSDRWTRAEVTV